MGKVNYYIDDKGTLHIFVGNYSVADVRACDKMSALEISKLVDRRAAPTVSRWAGSHGGGYHSHAHCGRAADDHRQVDHSRQLRKAI